MPTNRPAAPELTDEIAAALLFSADAVAVLHLGTRQVSLVAGAGDEVWEAPDLLVLATHDDALAASRVAAGRTDFRETLTGELNADLVALHAAGEIPTLEEVAVVLAELDHYEAEVIDLAAHRTSA